MKSLTKDQRKLLGEFCTNFSIAWLSVGLVVPLLSFQSERATNPIIFSLIIGLMFLTFGVSLVK